MSSDFSTSSPSFCDGDDLSMGKSLLHGASLVPGSLHRPALLQLVEMPITERVVDYVVQKTMELVTLAAVEPIGGASGDSYRPKLANVRSSLADFVVSTVQCCRVSMPSLLGALVYLNRARHRLRSMRDDMPCHRLFLAAVMVASKYLNDSTMINAHWERGTALFPAGDLLKMEIEFLVVLDFHTAISEHDVMLHYDALARPRRGAPPRSCTSLAITLDTFLLRSSSLGLSKCFPRPPSHIPVAKRRRADEPVPRSGSCSSVESASPRTPPDVVIIPPRVQGDTPKLSLEHAAGWDEHSFQAWRAPEWVDAETELLAKNAAVVHRVQSGMKRCHVPRLTALPPRRHREVCV